VTVEDDSLKEVEDEILSTVSSKGFAPLLQKSKGNGVQKNGVKKK
jgi:hypothetical protein